MNVIHILNKFEEGSTYQRKGLEVIKGSKPLQFKSGSWDPISMGFKTVDEFRDKMVGGMVFFHNSKTEPSFVGGLILEVDEVIEEQTKREVRLDITFQSMLEGKGEKWRGVDHMMSYNSGLVEITE